MGSAFMGVCGGIPRDIGNQLLESKRTPTETDLSNKRA